MVVNIDLQGSKASAFQHKVKTDFSATKPLTSPANQAISKDLLPLHAHKAYSQINFAGTLASHKSWGAAVQATGDVNFKLFTWPDAKKVFVEISDSIKPGENFRDGFIKLVQDAKGAITDIVADGSQKSRVVELSKIGDGVFEQKFAPNVAKDGEKYRFVIVKGNNEISSVKDPYAMKQDDVQSWSTIYDHHKYKWNDSDWQNGKVKEKISRVHYMNNNNLSNPYNMRICEISIDTLTKEGTFEAAKAALLKIAKDKQFNTIELMPVENTHSFNWGYDGVDKFAPRDSLGGPDKLKDLIDYAHQNKLNVIMDIVPNHVGPDGNALGQTGPYLDGDGPFGSFLNFEKKDSKYVREYIANSAMLWLRDYHCDGIRADMTKFMKSDNTMKGIAAEVNYHHPHAFLIAEDGRDNDWRVTRPLRPDEIAEDHIEGHCSYIEKISKNQVDLNNLGFGSEWDFPFHHKLAAAVLGSWGDDTKSIGALDAAIKSSPHRIKYFMSHDEKGNMDGTGLITKAVTNDLGMFFRVNGNCDSEKGQRAAQSTQALLTALVTGDADKMSSVKWENFNNRHNIKDIIPLDKLKESYQKAVSKHKLALGQTFVSPGPKMLFQGDESGKINPFKFFREFSDSKPEEELALTRQKGYESGKAALLDSKMTSINYSQEAQKTLSQMDLFTKKLANIIDENPALQEGQIQNTIVHEGSAVYGMHRKQGLNEIFTVSNFSDCGYNKNYNIKFPTGKWEEVLNSDANQFAGSGKFFNESKIQDGNAISLPANSIVIFKKI